MAPKGKGKDKGTGKANEAESGAKGKAAPEPNPELEHAVFYAKNSSAIRDDAAQLSACWKTGAGGLTKQEAGFLLAYHATADGGARAAELAGLGVGATCCAVLQDAGAPASQRDLAACMLECLARNTEAMQALVQGKAGGAACWKGLHAGMAAGGLTAQHAAKALLLLARDPVAQQALLAAADQQLPWPFYRQLLLHSRDYLFASHLAEFAAALCLQLKQPCTERAGAAGMIEALVQLLGSQKSAGCCAALAGLLAAVCTDGSSRQRAVEAGALALLVDLLGPPPAAALAWEREQQLAASQRLAQTQWSTVHSSVSSAATQTQQPLTSARSLGAGQQGVDDSMSKPGLVDGADQQQLQNARQMTIRFEDGTDAAAAAPEGLTSSGSMRRVPGGASATTPRSRQQAAGDTQPTVLPQSTSSRHLSSRQSGRLQAPSPPPPEATTSGRTLQRVGSLSSMASQPELLPRHDAAENAAQRPLSQNGSGVQWSSVVPVAHRALVARALSALLAHSEACCRQAADRLATHRLADAMAAMMAAAEGGGSGGKGKKAKKAKSKKKKAVKLDADQEALAVAVTSCWRSLTIIDNASCYVLAAAGAAKWLAAFAGSANLALRSNSKAVLAQMSCVEDCAAALADSEAPEELLQQRRMHLTASERAALMVQLPGCWLASPPLSPLQQLAAA